MRMEGKQKLVLELVEKRAKMIRWTEEVFDAQWDKERQHFEFELLSEYKERSGNNPVQMWE